MAVLTVQGRCSISSAPVTILFTALVNSTALLRQAGDERAQHVFQAHHKLLQDAVAASGGQEVKWLGDGMMVAFPSAADAVRCAISMQQAARSPVGGERIEIRVGLNVGEALRDEADYFGTPVVVARRLCDRSHGGQILSSRLVAGLLIGRQTFEFRDCGELKLKGIRNPVAVCEVAYDPDRQRAARRPPRAPQPETPQPSSTPVTILFTDLVNSTELLQEAGDERAQHIFQSHHKLLRDAAAAAGGQAVRWLGDGLMVAFSSAADAVRCAISMQQAARHPVGGERIEIRVGLNVGEALREETDYFGTPVVVARHLCDQAKGRQILCSKLVTGLLSGRQAFEFRDCEVLEIQAPAAPVEACEVVYDIDEGAALLGKPPFVGRGQEVAKLIQCLEDVSAGHGKLVMLVGEPGIGKTRLAQEFAETARGQGSTVLWGRSYEGEWAPPFGPFADAIEQYSLAGDDAALRDDLGTGAAAISRLVPALSERLPEIAEPAALQPDEERFRLLDAVSQFLARASARSPLVLVLEDLHWADKGTIAMLRHVTRLVPRHRILLLGTYRDVELDRIHPLADALGSLSRETNYERFALKGVEEGDVDQLLEIILGQRAPKGLAGILSSETEGNPFFLREVLLHLLESGAIESHTGTWTGATPSFDELGIPEGVRQVIGQRLSRLSEGTNRFLTVASAFDGAFHFTPVRHAAGLEEMPGLDAIDEALDAKLLQPSSATDSYEFTHALIRQTLYTELSPSRQVRLHRQIAEAMEEASGAGAPEQAGELAYQYHRSLALPGAERGVPHAVAAAARAQRSYAHNETSTFLRMALELLPQDDEQRPRLLGRAALALTWSLDFDEALKAVREAGDLIAASEGTKEAADYLAEAVRVMVAAGFLRGAWDAAAQGLDYAGDRRDGTWAWLMTIEILRREAEDPDNPGIPLDGPERREVARVEAQLPPGQRPRVVPSYESREDVLARGGDEDPISLVFLAGEYRRGLVVWEQLARQRQEQGQLANAVSDWAQVARCHIALGDFESAHEALDRGTGLASRLVDASPHQATQLFSARLDMRFALDPDIREPVAQAEPLLHQPKAEDSWALAAIRAVAAVGYAQSGRTGDALRWLGTLLAPLERAPGWAPGYTLMACLCATALWALERTDHIEVIERNVRQKVVEPDFRFPMQDGRLSMARLCALQRRFEEAVDWFEQARAVLEEQGARPLQAITYLDEATMYLQRAARGDANLARAHLDTALEQFRALGMDGWAVRAERLLESDSKP